MSASRKVLTAMAVASVIGIVSVSNLALADPLPSWNNGATKKAITSYISNTTRSGSASYVREKDRYAVFDLDGTLWPEYPIAEVDFTMHRIRDLAVRSPDFRTAEPYATILEKGASAMLTLSSEDLMKVFLETHSGVTEDDFNTKVRDFFYNAKHPHLGVPYQRTIYQPMLELMAHLREKGFRIFLVTNGDTAFARAISDEYFGIPPENVLGTYFLNSVEESGGRLRIMRQPKLGDFSDQEGKVGAIIRHIGKRPIFVAGNVGASESGGDAHMARYSREGTLPSFQLLVNHDDAARSQDYGNKDNLTLSWAKTYRWTVASIKQDWKRIFGAGTK